MTEVNWVLDQLGSVVDDVSNAYTDRNGNPVAIKRINRDDSSVYGGVGDIDMLEPIHKRKESLKGAVLVGATLADRATDPLGTEYDHETEAVIGVTIEGMTSQGGHYGQIDPAGEPGSGLYGAGLYGSGLYYNQDAGGNGIPFGVLVRKIRRTLLQSRTYPETDIPNTSYYTLLATNDDPQSYEYRDFYRYEFDVIFQGDETLP